MGSEHPVRQLRKKRGLTVEQLSKRSGVSVGAIKRTEAGTNDWKTNRGTAAALAKALGVTVDVLFKSDELSNLGHGLKLQPSKKLSKQEYVCQNCHVAIPKINGDKCPDCDPD